jgi:hypothetical protein
MTMTEIDKLALDLLWFKRELTQRARNKQRMETYLAKVTK